MADDMELSRWPLADHHFHSKEQREAEFKEWCAEEGARVRAQRFVFANTVMPEKASILIAALIERARELLDSGYPGAADQLLEFVPEADADRFLDAYFGDFEPQEGKTDDVKTDH